MLCAHGGCEWAHFSHPDNSSELIWLTQRVINTAGGAFGLDLHLTLTGLAINRVYTEATTWPEHPSEIIYSPLSILCPAEATKWNPMLPPRFSQWDRPSRYEDGYYIRTPWSQLGRWVGEFEVEKHLACVHLPLMSNWWKHFWASFYYELCCDCLRWVCCPSNAFGGQ